jgi:hypothetical protein
MTRFMTRSLLPLALLLIASAAFAGISSEHPVSTPVYGSANAALGESVASDGDGFLAVWLNPEESTLYASRIAADGTLLDPRGIFLANTFAAYGALAAWTGDSYLIVWNDSGNVNAIQLAADGRVLGSPRVLLRNAQLSGSRHALAANGNVIVVAATPGYVVLDRDANVILRDLFPAQAVYLAPSGEFIVTAGGGTSRLDASGRLALRTARGWPGLIACRASGCATAFLSPGHVVVAPYDPVSLVVGTGLEIPISSLFPIALDIAPTATGFLLLTNAVQRFGPDRQPLAAPVSLPGIIGNSASNGRDVAIISTVEGSLTASVVTPTAVTQPVAFAVSANAQHDVAIARGATSYLTAWRENNGTYAARLSLDGDPLDGRGALLGTGKGKPAVIFDGESYLAVVRSPLPCDGCGLQINPQSIMQIDPGTGNVLWVSTIGAIDLSIASNGFSRIAVWSEETRLVAAFLAPNGSIASVPVFVAAPPPGMMLTNVSIAWNSRVWLLTWIEERIRYGYLGGQGPGPGTVALRAARLSAELTPLDTQSLTITAPAVTNIVSPRAASDGRDFLVTWSAQAISETQRTVFVRRILGDGDPAGPKTALFPGTVQDLVWDGAHYALAFSGGKPSDLALARLDATGKPVDMLAISATAGDDRSASLVAAGPGSIIAAYTRVALEPLYNGVERAFVGVPHPFRQHATKLR